MNCCLRNAFVWNTDFKTYYLQKEKLLIVYSVLNCVKALLEYIKIRNIFLKEKYPFIERQFYLPQTQFNFKNEFQNVNRNGSA